MGAHHSSARPKTCRCHDDLEKGKPEETLPLLKTHQGPSRPLPVIEHVWSKPWPSPSIDRDPPTGEWYRYEIGTLHCPVRHQSLDRASNSPWFAKFILLIDDLELLSRVEFPWRVNLDKSCEDTIYVDRTSHVFIPSKAQYKRDI